MVVGRTQKHTPPGFLLESFGWAAVPVSKLIDLDPSICVNLCKIDRTRVHLIALALAHLQDQLTSDLALLLLRGSLRQVMTETLGRGPPAGLSRAVAHMPFKVLTKENYRRLVELLYQAPTAKVLFHVDAIDDEMIDVLYRTPVSLRRALLLLATHRGGDWPQFAGLADGLRILAARGAAHSFDELVNNLASARKPRQFLAKLKSICDCLPLAEDMPPARIGLARRLDCIGELRALASQWQNCLLDYIDSVNEGGCAIYLWQDERTSAACLVNRHGRFGWFLDEVVGPKNAEIKVRQERIIRQTFAEVGVPQCAMIQAVENLYDSLSEPLFDM